MDEARRRTIRRLAASGTSSRKVKGVVDGAPGFSSSNYSRQLKVVGEEDTANVNTRSFNDPKNPVVWMWADVTAIGTRGKKRGVLIVTGLRADGTVVTLGTGMAPWESAEDIYKVFKSIVERGVDPGTPITTDGGAGIQAALKMMARLKPPRPELGANPADRNPMPLPRVQLCTTHVAGNVAKAISTDKKIQEPWRLRIYGAWKLDDANAALDELGTIVDDLRQEGYEQAAATLENSMKGTVTVQLLGIEGRLREEVRSTNRAEGPVNSGVKVGGSTKNVTRWKNDKMRLRHANQRLTELENTSWTRVAEPERLVELAGKLFPGRYNLEAMLAGLPPTMSVDKLPVPAGKDKLTPEFAAKWCQEHPDAAWVGSDGALEALGLTGDTELTPAALVDAMRCVNPKAKTGKCLRDHHEVIVKHRGKDGKSVEKAVAGIYNVQWELTASPAAMNEWRKGGPAREWIEAKLKEAASTAVRHVTRTATSDTHGFAGIMALRLPSPEEPDQPVSVIGITFAVQRGKTAELDSPTPTKKMVESKFVRAAEDAAKVILDDAIREAVELELDPRPTPELLAGVQARALELAPGMVATEPEKLEALANDATEARDGLNEIARGVRAWVEENWDAAARQIAAARLRAGPSSSPEEKRWGPLTRGLRLVLGEKRSQQLLGDAALLTGVAEGDPEMARDLRKAGEDPLGKLREVVKRVEEAAEAIAAEGERERRRLFEEARDGDGRAPPADVLRDSRGVLSADAIDHSSKALGPRAEALERYAKEVAGELRKLKLDEPALQRLVVGTAATWNALSAGTGLRQVHEEEARDARLDEMLRALRESGRYTGAGRVADRDEKGGDFVAAEEKADETMVPAREAWSELRDIEARLNELRQAGGGPDSLLAAYPEAAIHFAALKERERARQHAPRPLATEGGRDQSQVNQYDMADNGSSSVDALKDLTPVFTATRIFVPQKGELPAEAKLDAAGGHTWWIGDQDVLGKFGGAPNGKLEGAAVDHAVRGRDAEGEVVRKANTTKSDRGAGWVQMAGTFEAPPMFARMWREAPEREDEITAALLDWTTAGIGEIAGTKEIAAVATLIEVGEGDEAAPQLNWVAVAANRDKGLVTAFDPKGIKAVDQVARGIAEDLQEKRKALEARPREQGPRPEQAPAELPAQQTREPDLAPAWARDFPLPSGPLRDSLATWREKLGDDLAAEIDKGAQSTAIDLDLGQLHDEELRELMPKRNPFDMLSRASDPHAWHQHNRDDIERTRAFERMLIDHAARSYDKLAERESERRSVNVDGEWRRLEMVDPMAKVRKVRGEEYAAKVARHAAVFASTLTPEDERQSRTAALREEIDKKGLQEASFGTIVEAVGLQHGRNLHNELEAERLAREAAREPQLAVAKVAEQSVDHALA